MTSLERIRAAAKGLPVDRVPIFIWLNAHTGCKMIARNRPSKSRALNAFSRFLWNRFEAGGEGNAKEIWRMLPLMHDVHTFNWANEYSLELGSDMIMAAHATPWRYAKYFMEDGHIRVKDWFGVIRGIYGIYPDVLRHPLTDIKKALDYNFPDTKDPSLYGIFRKYRKAYPDKSICAEIWSVQDFTATSMFGMERFMTFLYDYPDEMKTFMKRWADFQIDIMHRSVQAGADMVGIFDDYGFDNSPLMSMKMWKEFTYPELKRLVDAAKNMGAVAMLHSCGYQMPFLEYYVEAGIDMLQSFQPKAGNDFEEAYSKYGDRITFITGIDIQRGEFMSPEELKNDIIRNYRIGKEKRRHVLGTTHEMQYTMPDENVAAIFDTLEQIKTGAFDS